MLSIILHEKNYKIHDKLKISLFSKVPDYTHLEATLLTRKLDAK